MDASEFEDYLDRYGGDLADWPPNLRLQAAVLMGASREARAAFLAMGDIEAVLRQPVAQVDGADVMADVMAARAMQNRQIRPIAMFARRAGWASAVAAALVLGLFVGDLGPSSRHEDNPANVMAAAFDGNAFDAADATGSVDVD